MSDYSQLPTDRLYQIIESDIWRVRELWARNDELSIKCMHKESYNARVELVRREVAIPEHLSLEYPALEIPDFGELQLTLEERAALPTAQKGLEDGELLSLHDAIQLFVEERSGPFKEFLEEFRGQLLHTTTESNWSSIETDCEIKPSDGILQGAYKYEPGVAPESRNMGHNLGAVSLWDLSNPTGAEWLMYGRHWLSEFRVITKGSGILVCLDRSRLPLGLYDPRDSNEQCYGRHLPGIEVFHRGPIPLEVIEKVYCFWTEDDRVKFAHLCLPDRRSQQAEETG